MKRHNEITQGTEAWYHIRKGKITGTTLKSIMGTPKARKEALYEIIAERLTVGVEMEYENPMDRGIRLEADAISLFEFETGKKVERTGYCEDDENSLIGYSPDGIIAETDDTEDIEVKCPGGKNHVKIWLTNEVPEEYHWQMVQGFITNPKLQKRYFVSYNPDIPAHSLHIIEVKREDMEEWIKGARVAQELFIKEVEEELSKIIKL